MRRQERAVAQRLKVWPLLDLGLYPIPVDPQTRKPLVRQSVRTRVHGVAADCAPCTSTPAPAGCTCTTAPPR